MIKNIAISGAGISKDVQFNTIVDSYRNTSINTLNLQDLKYELESLELVKEAKIFKNYPNILKIEIIERTPIAQLKTANTVFTVDKEGVIIPINPSGISPEISVSFGVAINGKQIADEYLLQMISALTSTNTVSIESIRINKNRETYFRLKGLKSEFYIDKTILTEELIEKAMRIAKTIEENNITKLPKSVDIYSDKNSAVGIYN